jgi:general secretion pathway protein H
MARSKTSGFTLIEMMVVVAIIAGMAVISMPYLNNRSPGTKKFLREFTVLSRELHTRAKLNGVIYRLVIDMPEQISGASEQEPHKFWVEVGNAKFIMSADDEDNAQKRLKESDKDKQADPKGYSVDNTIIKEKKELPSELRFDRVELARVKEPITRGRAFIHYLPQGLVDEAAIHIKGDRGQTWTVSIHPLTGKAELISKSVSLKDMQSQ